MPLRTNDGKLLIRKFRLVKAREDECCCDTDLTCCGGQCIPPCCNVIARITLNDCFDAQGSCVDPYTGDSRPASSEEECTCTTVNEYGYEYEVCEYYSVPTTEIIDIDITNLFSNQDSEDNEGGPCYAHFSWPTGGGSSNSFYFKNSISQNWSDLANWYSDELFRIPAPALPGPNDKIYITGAINFVAAFRMANTENDVIVFKEIELINDNVSISGEVTTNSLTLNNGSISAGSHITILNRLQAENTNIAGTVTLNFRAFAVFTGNTVLSSSAVINNTAGSTVLFADDAENNGTINSETVGSGALTVFKNNAKNKGSVIGSRTRFFNATENTGTVDARKDDGEYEVWFSSSAKNKETVYGRAVFYGKNTALAQEPGETAAEYSARISTGNYGTVIGSAWFFAGADNQAGAVVNGKALFNHGNNYGTVTYGAFVSNITEGGLGFSGGKARNYGKVLKTAIFRGIGGDSQGVIEGAINEETGCVNEWAWFDSHSFNLGQPNPDNAPAGGPARTYYCPTLDCCDENSESLQPQQIRMAFTAGEDPPEPLPEPPEPTEPPTPEEESCQASLLSCSMNFRVSSACRHLRDCPSGDGPSNCGVNCYYEIMIQTGIDANGRPVYQYLYESAAQARRCYGVSNIQIIESCEDYDYAPNGNTLGGECKQNLTSEQCRIRGGVWYSGENPARQCEAQPCDICCGIEICTTLIGALNPDGSQITAAECIQCDKVCIDADGNERNVESAADCQSCYEYWDPGYDPYNTETSSEQPSSEAPPCNPETFEQRGRCGKIIPGTDSILHELSVCATTSSFNNKSHRCDYDTEFPMVLCATGDFIAEHLAFDASGQAALPNSYYLGLSGSFTESFAGPYAWGYSVGLNIGQGVELVPDGCGGWNFGAYRDGRGGLYATVLGASGNYKPTLSCGTCHPESIEVKGAGRKWVVDPDTGTYTPVDFTIDETVSFTEGYRCWLGYFGFTSQYGGSCVPCSEIGYIDAPRGFEPPPYSYLKELPRESNLQAPSSASMVESSSSEALDESLAPPEEKELDDADVPPAMWPALNKLRAAHPTKIIVVKKLRSGRYSFVTKNQNVNLTQPVREQLVAAEPKDCLYGVDDPTGTGTFLSSMLEKIGIKASPNCACKTRAKIMNCRGPDWCEENIDKIVGWLREEATKRKLPFIDFAGKLLIKRAIGLARAAKKADSR